VCKIITILVIRKTNEYLFINYKERFMSFLKITPKVVLFLLVFAYSCKSDTIYTLEKLPKPDMTGGKPLMVALKNRCSTREFSEKELTLQQISDLLWAANGINRPDKKGRTAPSAMNKQEVDVYVAMKSGVYIHDYKKHSLIKVLDSDIRTDIGHQPFVKEAPICLIYVADYSKLDGMDKSNSAVTSAYISENVYLYCASENLATVVLGYIQADKISEHLKLDSIHGVVLAQPVGNMK
jgi:nitroreductase